MLSIMQSVENHMWTQAAEACASALSVLKKKEQLQIAKIFLKHAEVDFVMFDKDWRIAEGRVLHTLESINKRMAPWQVHFADARDELEEMENLNDSAPDLPARAASILWEIIFGLQVAAWALEDPDDYNKWTVGQEAVGVYESKNGNKVGKHHWLMLDRIIKYYPEFNGQPDQEIYKVRQAVITFKETYEDDVN